MKALKIYEIIDFKSGGDPYKTLRLGANREIKLGDKFEWLDDIYYNYTDETLSTKAATIDSNNTKAPVVYCEEKMHILEISINTYKIGVKSSDYIEIPKKQFSEFLADGVIKRI